MVAVEKQQVLHILSVCVQRAMRMRHVVIRGLPDCTLRFPHYLTNGTILEKTLLNMKCMFFLYFLQLLSENFSF